MSVRAHADVKTRSAELLVRRLCKHWAHHFAVTEQGHTSEIRFDESSVCRLELIPTGLHVVVEAPTANALAELQQVVAEHLARMLKDQSLAITWQ